MSTQPLDRLKADILPDSINSSSATFKTTPREESAYRTRILLASIFLFSQAPLFDAIEQI
jgi:hypothetical protein